MSTLWILLKRSSILEQKFLKFFVIRCYWRTLEVTKGQMEDKNQKMKKVNNMGIVGKDFNCRVQLFENFCH